MRNFLLHLRNGNRIITEQEAIEEAKRQEADGLKPCYAWIHDENATPGYLVWSTLADGCGVCCKGTDGNYHIMTGWQGDFKIKY